MTNRKDEIAWLAEKLNEIVESKGLCPDCREAVASEETGLCERCTLFASYERRIAGEDR